MQEVKAFQAALAGLQGQDNAVRAEAERIITELREHDTDKCVRLLLQCLDVAHEASGRFAAAVLLRRTFRMEGVWSRVTAETRAQMKGYLLKVLEEDENEQVNKGLCDVVACAYQLLVETDSWPELKGTLLRLLQSNRELMLKRGCRILQEVIGTMAPELALVPNELAKFLSQALRHESLSVRAAAIGAVASAIEAENRVLRTALNPLASQCTETLTLAVETASIEVLNIFESLVMIAEYHCAFFKPDLANLAQLCLTVARNCNSEQAWRQMAAELLLTCVEQRRKMMLNAGTVVQQMICIFFEMVAQVKDEDFQEWLDSEHETRDVDHMSDIGEESLDRLANAYETHPQVTAAIVEAIKESARRPEWYYQVASLFAIAQTCEYLHEDSVEDVLDELMGIVMEKLQSSHSGVRFAACQALGQIALDHVPYVQEAYAKVVLGALLGTMNDDHHRVQSHACSAFVNFAEEVEKPVLLEFVEPYMELLLNLSVNSRSTLVKQQAVTGIAVVAGVLETDFERYLTRTVPMLTQVINGFLEPGQKTCRGKAVECLSIIALSLGQEKLGNQLHDIMKLILPLWSSDAGEEDILQDYVQEAISRMCRVLGRESGTYVPEIVPKIFAVLGQAPVSMSDEAEDGTTAVMSLNGKSLGLKTSVIEAQEQGLELLTALVDVQGEEFVPYLKATIAAVVPLMEYTFCESLKHKALSLMAELIKVAQACAAKGSLDWDLLRGTVADLTKRLLHSLDRSIGGETEMEMMVSEASGFRQCLTVAGPEVFGAQMLQEMVPFILKLLDQSTQRKFSRLKQRDAVDEDELAALKDAEDHEQALREALVGTLGIIMRHHAAAFLQTCSAMTVDHIKALLSFPAPKGDKLLAVSLCEIVVAELQEQGLSLWPYVVPVCVEHLIDGDCSVRQAAAFSVNRASQHESFSYYVHGAAKNLGLALEKHASTTKRSIQLSNDNLVAALGSVLKRFGSALPNADSLLRLWLFALPLRQDDEEAQIVHQDFVQLLMERNSALMGVNNAHLPQIVAVVSSIYSTIFSNPTLDAQIAQEVAKFGQSVVQPIYAQLKPKQQKRLTRMFQDASQPH